MASSDNNAEPSLTPFQSRVYEVVGTIPKGSVRTYGSIAQELQTSARAVGTAMGRNPYGPCDEVPWHRVVASDRTLGGFGHTWGEDQPKVQKKKRMLEDEGIIFEKEHGMSSKIRKDFFVESVSVTNSATRKPASTASGKGSNKRKIEEPTNQTTTTKKKSKYFDTVSVSEETLKQEILSLLQKRQAGKTCWPSEIPRGLVKRGGIPSSIDWRSLMGPIRDAARSLSREDRIDVMQKGSVLGKDEEYRGPIRLRLCLD